MLTKWTHLLDQEREHSSTLENRPLPLCDCYLQVNASLTSPLISAAWFWTLDTWSHWGYILPGWRLSVSIAMVRSVHPVTGSFILFVPIAIWCFTVWTYHSSSILPLTDIGLLPVGGHDHGAAMNPLAHVYWCSVHAFLLGKYLRFATVTRKIAYNSFSRYHHVIFRSVTPVHPSGTAWVSACGSTSSPALLVLDKVRAKRGFCLHFLND